MANVPFTIRDFLPADFDILWRIDQECFPPGISYSKSELKTYIRRRDAFTLVAESDSEPKSQRAAESTLTPLPIAGFIVGEVHRGFGHIITIDVVAAARRCGVGSLLLGAAEGSLRAAGCHAVDLETAVDNLSALSFYKRHGYSVTRTFPRYYSNGIDALVLQKNLAQR